MSSESGSSVKQEVVKEIKKLRKRRGQKKVNDYTLDMKLTENLGLNSFDLAELTVKLEDKFGVDIFENQNPETLGQVISKIESNE